MSAEDTIVQIQMYRLEVHQTLELQQLEIGLDVINAENTNILQMNILIQLQIILMVMNQIEQHCD